MLNKFDETLKGKKVVVAVSGGVDSMVLLDICLKSDFAEIVVVHFDHGVRQDSFKDYDLIKKYLIEQNFDLEKLVLKKLCFDSMANFEAEARKKRYEYLEEVRVNRGFDLIITAHHQDDQIETVFLNFIKGSFVSGLAGLAKEDPKRHLVRPLISFTKNDLIQYALENNVSYLQDSTNSDSKYLRNYLRNELIPELNHKLGSLTALARNAEFYSELSRFIDNIVVNFVAENLINSEIERVKLQELPNFLRFKVYTYLLPEYPLSVADFSQIDSLLFDGVTGKYRQMGNVKFLIEKKKLKIC